MQYNYMLKYLIIQLSDKSPSFCHYVNNRTEERTIAPVLLGKAILMAMQQNWTVQIVWPYHQISAELKKEIEKIDHINIVPSSLTTDADIVVSETVSDLVNLPSGSNVVLRSALKSLEDNVLVVEESLARFSRLNIFLTDIEAMGEKDFEQYSAILGRLANKIKSEYAKGHYVQLNSLTDRMMLDAMNNCNAGFESVTLAPDGKFYICPAFYLDGSESLGDVESGLKIKNKQLFRLDHAPICRRCDAYQCRRCIWLNKKTTLEGNSPSHEQCVVAHIERNASKKLLDSVRELGEFLPEKSIEEIDYLDPFDIINEK